MKKRFLILTACLSLISIALLIWRYAIPALNAQTFYIAMVGPLSGAEASSGREMLNGISLSLKHARSDGKLQGKKIQILQFDDRGDEETALTIARELAEDDRILLVLGHLQNSTSLAAGQIYKRERIPAITASATADPITQGNEWYFRTSPKDSVQAEFTAQYIKFALHAETTVLIYGSGSYDSFLTTPFEETADRIGLKIQKKLRVRVGRSDIGRQLQSIGQSLQELKEPGVIFLALPSSESIELIRLLQDAGQNYTFIGTDALLSSDNSLDGVYATAPFIYQSAGPEAQAFRREYFEEFSEAPSWIAASYYDAAAVAVEAIIRNEHTLRGEKYIRSDRNKIRQTLAESYNSDKAVEGITAKLYFDLNGDVNFPHSVGTYEQQQFVPAFTQYHVTEQPGPDEQLFNRLISGEIITVNEQMAQQFQIVYTGMVIHDITQLDLKDARYTVDFSLWFRFKYHENGAAFISNLDTQERAIQSSSPHSNLTFEDAVSPVRMGLPILREHSSDGQTLEVYRIQTEFKHHFNFQAYPFDSHALPIQFHNTVLPSSLLVYVQDLKGVPEALKASQEEQGDIFLRRFDKWKVADITMTPDVMRINSTLGNPQLFATRPGIHYSRVTTDIHIQREDAAFAITQFLPIILVLSLVVSMHFTPPDWLGLRASCFMVALLMAALIHTNFVSELPITYLSYFEYALLGVYIATAIAMYISISAYIFYMRRLKLLKQSFLFAPFPDKMKVRLSRKMRLHRIKEPDYRVIRQGDRGDSLFMIIEGEVKIVVQKDGKPDEVNRIAAGAFFGELALLTGQQRSADVITTSPVILGEITKDHLHPIFKEHPELVFSISEEVLRRGLLDEDSVPEQYSRDIQEFFGLPTST